MLNVYIIITWSHLTSPLFLHLLTPRIKLWLKFFRREKAGRAHGAGKDRRIPFPHLVFHIITEILTVK